jgi:hypothetical protein
MCASACTALTEYRKAITLLARDVSHLGLPLVNVPSLCVGKHFISFRKKIQVDGTASTGRILKARYETAIFVEFTNS